MKHIHVTFIPMLLFLMVFFLQPVTAEEKEKPKDIHAPETLPGVEPEMLSADYWISLHTDAEKTVMTLDEIQAFNRKVKDKKIVFSDRYGESDPMIRNYYEKLSIGLYMNPVLTYELPETVPGDSLRAWLKSNIKYLNSQDFHDSRNVTWSEMQKTGLVASMNVDAIPDIITRRQALVVQRADMRLFPTHQPGFSNLKWALDFFQTTAVYSYAPAVVLHSTVNGDYYYVQTAFARGWMAADKVAFADRKTVREIAESDDFLMAIGDRVAVYGDPSHTQFLRYFHMSEKLPLASLSPRSVRVKIPYRESDGKLAFADGYIKPDADIHNGFLPYTRGNVYRQMFKMLDTPYGWADQFGKRDCSGAVRVVLYSFGFEVGRWPNFILLAPDTITYIDPRLSEEEMIDEVSRLEGGITFAGSGGHIALYLGKARNGKLYYMHQGGWGYDEGDQHYYVNRVQINEVHHSWYNVKATPVFSTFK